MQLAANYRLYELPWSPTAEVDQRFRRVVRNTMLVFLVLGLVIPFLPVPEKSLVKAPELPDRVVKLVLENRKPIPPPPPPVQEKEKIETPKPIEKPVAKVEPKPEPDRQEEAKKKAQK